jgi:hypothetical protein
LATGQNASSVPPGSYTGVYSSLSTTSSINEFGQTTRAVTTTGAITCWGSNYNDDTIALPPRQGDPPSVAASRIAARWQQA